MASSVSPKVIRVGLDPQPREDNFRIRTQIWGLKYIRKITHVVP